MNPSKVLDLLSYKRDEKSPDAKLLLLKRSRQGKGSVQVLDIF